MHGSCQQAWQIPGCGFEPELEQLHLLCLTRCKKPENCHMHLLQCIHSISQSASEGLKPWLPRRTCLPATPASPSGGLVLQRPATEGHKHTLCWLPQQGWYCCVYASSTLCCRLAITTPQAFRSTHHLHLAPHASVRVRRSSTGAVPLPHPGTLKTLEPPPAAAWPLLCVCSPQGRAGTPQLPRAPSQPGPAPVQQGTLGPGARGGGTGVWGAC